MSGWPCALMSAAKTRPVPPRFGEVWTVKGSVLGPLPVLVVSGDLYNDAYGEIRVLTAEIDTRGLRGGGLREPVEDQGTALLDRISWLPRGHLVERVGELHQSRHAHVTQVI